MSRPSSFGNGNSYEADDFSLQNVVSIAELEPTCRRLYSSQAFRSPLPLDGQEMGRVYPNFSNPAFLGLEVKLRSKPTRTSISIQ